MPIPQTTAELLEILSKIQGSNTDSDEERKKYRYVIYCRKSTDSEEKQVRSLADQLSECQEFATEQGFDVRGFIQESESAKYSETRPKFKQMVDDLKKGKYDGVIAWHPDRLARNMKDAGEVIDLLDKKIIKDLKFVSFTFENNMSGKMLLGITFVLAKQYSDQLSENISRGNRRSIEEGRYVNRAKHGYYKDSNQYLRPDGENFLIIKKAFQMRLKEATLQQISDFLNKSGYQRVRRDGSHEIYKFDFKRVYDLMRDPVYAGVIVYGKKGGKVDLTQIYDFEPAISVSDFMKINALTENSQMIKLARKFKKAEDIKANLMRGMVICADCDEPMTAGITIKKNARKGITRYLYYRCVTDDCPNENKSVRAKVIMDYIKDFLAKKPFSSKKAYEHYAAEMEQVSAKRTKEAQVTLIARKTQRGKLENKLAKMKEVFANETDQQIKDSYRRDIKKAETDIAAATEEIAVLQRKANATKTAILTYDEFIELFEKVPKILSQIKQMQELDYVIKKIFSNFSVQGKKVTKSTLSAPFDGLSDLNFTKGGDGRTRTAV